MKETVKDILKELGIVLLILIALYSIYLMFYPRSEVEKIKEETYEEAYNEGYEEGYGDGYDEGWEKGADAGYDVGYSDGYYDAGGK